MYFYTFIQIIYHTAYNVGPTSAQQKNKRKFDLLPYSILNFNIEYISEFLNTLK